MKNDKALQEHNTLCQRCANACKQPVHVKLIKCPHFDPAAQQLEIPLFGKSRKKTKTS